VLQTSGLTGPLEKRNDLEISTTATARTTTTTIIIATTTTLAKMNATLNCLPTVLVFRTSVAICFAQVWVVK